MQIVLLLLFILDFRRQKQESPVLRLQWKLTNRM